MTRIFIRDLTPGTDYALQLRTDAGDSVSNWSRLFPLTTIGDTDAPDAVAWVSPDGSAWYTDANSFVAKWVGLNMALPQNLDFSHYEISFTDNTTTFTRKLTGTSYVLTYEENKAMFGTAAALVKAKVRAVDQTGNTSAYNTELTASNAAPLAPTSVDAEPVADGIKISWVNSVSDDVVGYNIYIGTATAPTTKVAFTTSNPYTYTSLTFVPQFVRVRAVDVFGQESPYSNEDSATPESPFVIDGTAPDAPTAFDAVISNQDTGTVITRQVATLTWTLASPPSDLAGFHIRYKKTGTTSWAILNANPEAREFLITLPEPFVGYDFEIRSYDLYTNKSAWVSDNPGAVTTYTPPEFIQDLIIGGGGSIESSNFATGISGFRIDEDSIIINEGLVSGSVITTGIIHSTEPALDADGLPITGEFAWQIDLEGDAVFGDTKIRGSMVVGYGEIEGDQLSVVQSANYIPGEQGWMLRSDGTVEFRNIVDNSINGSSIEAGTISVATLAAGEMKANIDLLSNITATGEMGEEVTLGAAGFTVLGPDEVVITNKAVASGVATLTTATAHGFREGNKILVLTGDELFDGQFIIDTIPTTTTFTFATSVADFASAAITGIVKGRDYTGLNSGPKYVEFPTDGTQPNIISGQLTADKLTITGGATFRGISGIEMGAQLVIDNDVLAPKNAPVAGVNYNDVPIRDIPKGFAGHAGEIKRTIVGATLGHTGNLFILAVGGNNNYSLTEHNKTTGELLNTIWDQSYVSTIYIRMRGIAYSSTRSKYYVYYNVESRGGTYQHVVTYDTSFAEVSEEGFLVGYNSFGSTSGNYLSNISTGTIGWDFAGDRLMWVGQTAPEADPLVRFFTHDGTTGEATGFEVGSYALGTNDVFNSPAYIARGDFDFGNTRIVYRDRAYNAAQASQVSFKVYPANGGVYYPNESWPTPYKTTTMAAYWDTGTGKFSNITGADTLCELQGGDSYWGRLFTVTNKALTSNVATLTTSTAHDFRKGMTVVVAGVDATFNGTYTVTSVPTSTTFTYAKSALNVASVASGGTVYSNYSGIRWLGYSWYDNVGTTHETNLSPRIYATLPKRAIQTVTINPIPYGIGADAPKQARVYTSRQTTDPGVDGTEWHLRSTISYPSTMGKVSPYDADNATTPLTTNSFLLISTTPGQIKSSTGESFWKGDDTAQFKSLVLIGQTDVNTSSGNLPPLRIGNTGGVHLRVDGNEIQAMAGPSTTGSLFLNVGGSGVRLGNGGRNVLGLDFGTTSINTNSSGADTIPHDLGSSPSAVVATVGGVGETLYRVSVIGKSATNFTVEVRNSSTNATAAAGSTPSINWFAIR